MLSDLMEGITGFFSLKNLGALLMLFLVAVALAWARATPDQVASKLPPPEELLGTG